LAWWSEIGEWSDFVGTIRSEIGQDEFPGLGFMVDLQEGCICTDEGWHQRIIPGDGVDPTGSHNDSWKLGCIQNCDDLES